jgi:hypothetical protein
LSGLMIFGDLFIPGGTSHSTHWRRGWETPGLISTWWGRGKS